jgi:hypothetical protein
VVRRALPAALAVIAAVADSRGAYGLAWDVLLLAVPCTAVAGVAAFGDLVDERDKPFVGTQCVLWAVGLALVVLSCAVRSPAAQTHQLPALASSALTVCLAVFALKGLLVLAPYARGALRPAKP